MALYGKILGLARANAQEQTLCDKGRQSSTSTDRSQFTCSNNICPWRDEKDVLV